MDRLRETELIREALKARIKVQLKDLSNAGYSVESDNTEILLDDLRDLLHDLQDLVDYSSKEL